MMAEEPKTLSVVDDDESMRKAIKRLLSAWGYRVSSYASADEFLQAAPPDSSDCLILDIHMPGMDGFQLQQVLIDKGSRTPIIFITADADPRIGDRGIEAGAIGILHKPFDEDALRSLIHAAFAKRNN